MAYSKVERQTRNDERFRTWGRTRRDVWHYLLCNPHMDGIGGRMGCYVLDPAYITADLTAPDWRPTIDEIEAELRALDAEERIVWDPSVRLILLRQFFRHNQPENPNVVTACVNDVARLPYSETVSKGLISAVEELVPERFAKGQPCGSAIADAVRSRMEAERAKGAVRKSLNGSPTVPERLPQPFRNQEQLQEQEQEQIKPPKGPPSKSSKAKRAHRLPEDWKPTEKHRLKAIDCGVDLDREAERMRDWAEAKGATAVSWDARFNLWLGKSKQMNGSSRRDDAEAEYEELMRDLQNNMKI